MNGNEKAAAAAYAPPVKITNNRYLGAEIQPVMIMGRPTQPAVYVQGVICLDVASAMNAIEDWLIQAFDEEKRRLATPVQEHRV